MISVSPSSCVSGRRLSELFRVARVGVESTDDHKILSFAALPVCVPGRKRPRPRIVFHMTVLNEVRGAGLEPASPGSKSGSLPLADPRRTGVSCIWNEVGPE